MKLPLIPCPNCRGKGNVPDRSRIGPALRAAREMKGVPSLSVARALNVPKSTLHEMERGRFANLWTPDFIRCYRNAIDRIAAAKSKVERRRR